MINIEKEWVTEAGLTARCLIVHNSHRCGYVCVPPDHILYGLDYDSVYDVYPEISVHGGLTFAGRLLENNSWWIGFDCAHYGDGSMNPLLKFTPVEFPVRDLEYVEQECESLAEQIQNL